MNKNVHLNKVLNETVNDMIDSCIMDGIMTMHRAIKLGYFHIISPDMKAYERESSQSFSQNSTLTSNRDLLSKGHVCCRCVKCNSKVAATRYASHLSNCMGLGRNSSRRANKRIAEQQRLEDYDEDLEEDRAIAASVANVKNLQSSHSSSLDSETGRNLSPGVSYQSTSQNLTTSGSSSSLVTSACTRISNSVRSRRSNSPVVPMPSSTVESVSACPPRYSHQRLGQNFHQVIAADHNSGDSNHSIGKASPSIDGISGSSPSEDLIEYDDEAEGEDLDSTLEAISTNSVTPVLVRAEPLVLSGSHSNTSNMANKRSNDLTRPSNRDRRSQVNLFNSTASQS